MKWLVLLVLAGCNNPFQSDSILKEDKCRIDCDFRGATSYSISLAHSWECFCTFKLRGRK